MGPGSRAPPRRVAPQWSARPGRQSFNLAPMGLAFRERLAWKPGILGVGQGVREAIPFRAPQAERKPNPKFVMP